jgi:hypothetical protein
MMVAPAPVPGPEPKFWHDCIVAPFETMIEVYEQLDARGWEIVSTFNTGMTMNIKPSLLLPGNAPQATALIAVMCRIKRTGKERRYAFPEKRPQGNVLDGKFPPPPDAAQDI